MNHLIEFGYLPMSYSQTKNEYQLKEAIKSFQQSNQMQTSGFIDDKTCKLMGQPQCAGMILPDSLDFSKDNYLKHRIRRYANFQLKWPRMNLTWR